VLGKGGGSASELTAGGAIVASPAGFAAELWNHAPEMWTAMERQGFERQPLSPQDVRDIFTFLYAVRYFEPSGDIDRGRRVFAGKACHRCHALVRTDAGGIGPAVPDWPSLTDPVRFLEAMWNHGEAMEEETNADRIQWPALTRRELADLLAYVYNLPERPPTLGRLALGSANAGMRLFDDLGCVDCHSILETDADLIPLAPPLGGHYTLTDLAVAMWNHQPVMREWAEATGRRIPMLESGQMGQILSYLMEEGFLDRRGNEKRGARLFRSRGCETCHGAGGRELPSRDWRAADLVSAVWAHGPGMRQRMSEDGMAWPTLSEADMADLIAWMNVR
jgi:mono/diheme cytochrome c family protein